jgi:hypothetical protein
MECGLSEKGDIQFHSQSTASSDHILGDKKTTIAHTKL